MDDLVEKKWKRLVDLLSEGWSNKSNLVVSGGEVILNENGIPGLGVTSEHREEDEKDDAVETEEKEQKLTKYYATLTGGIEQVNSLSYVKPVFYRYRPEIGDTVIGRVCEVGQGRWYIDICSTKPAALQLATISLPEQRRKTDAELTDLRQFFKENDLLCTEVQNVTQEGNCVLHTRSSRYGTLSNGVLITVPCALIPSLSQYMVPLPNGVHLILARNGQIFVSSPPRVDALDTLNYSAFHSERFQKVSPELRLKIAKILQCVAFLAKHSQIISAHTIMLVHDVVTQLEIPTPKINQPTNRFPILKKILSIQ